MAQPHVVSGLLKKRSELMGLIEVKRKELNGLMVTLDALDTTCKLFDESVSFTGIKPKRTYQKNRLFGHGEASRMVLETLRGQTAMKTADIAEIIRIEKGFGEELKPKLTYSVEQSLRYLAKQGQVTQSKKDGRNHWSIA